MWPVCRPDSEYFLIFDVSHRSKSDCDSDNVPMKLLRRECPSMNALLQIVKWNVLSFGE